MHKIFVYGTLKTGQPNNYLMKNVDNGVQNFIGMARTKEKFPLVISSRYNIPFMLSTKSDKAKNVQGELYEVDDSKLKVLDKLESHPHFYSRTPVEVVMETDGRTESCQCYFLTDPKPFLFDLEYLESYDTNGKHGLKYTSPQDRRDPPELTRSDVQNNPAKPK